MSAAHRGVALAMALVGPGAHAAEPVEWTYLCPDGSMFFASAAERSATVRALGMTLTLPIAPSGSGGRYADAHWVFRNTGRSARLERDGQPLFVDCQGTPGSEGRPAAEGGPHRWRTVRGTVTTREPMALPPTAELEVRLGDVSRADVPEIKLAELRLPVDPGMPMSFELRYDPAGIDPRMRYQVRARIVDGERLLFLSDRAVPVITGYPNPVELVLIRASPSSNGSPLVGPPWQLQRLTVPDQPLVKPEDPSRYTLQFLDAARVGLRADCNRGSGHYTVDGAKLSLERMATTLAACAPGSHDGPFTRALSTVESYRLQEGTLELQMEGGGVLTFRRAAGG